MKCRHCNTELRLPFLDLGSAPPSNAYLNASTLNAPETWFPLRLLVCTHCWLVQTEDHAGREALFTNQYAYFSSYSTSWLAHAKAHVQSMQQWLALDARSCVVEVASNDGYLLQYVKAAGISCYGIEPTTSTATAARALGLEVVERFFGMALADELARAGRQADWMVANNVLAHVPDINDFVAGFARLLKPQGVVTFEFPHLLRMVQGCQFDTAYHEHYSYLSLHTAAQIFERNGLQIFDVEELTTHGGSLRVYVQLQASGQQVVDIRVKNLLDREVRAGMLSQHLYEEFQREAIAVKCDVLRFLLQARNRGEKVGGYGAAAKGNTLLNFAGVRPDLLPYVVDLNPAKQGKSMPGSRIPIVGEAHLKGDRPDWILVLPWNLKTEIVAQLTYVSQWGGRLVTPIELKEYLT